MSSNADKPFDLIQSVRRFMEIPGQYKGHGELAMYGFYFGMQLEELSEKLERIASACPVTDDRVRMQHFAAIMKVLANEFKAGMHRSALGFANLGDMIDDDIDMAWVSIAAAHFAAKDEVNAQLAIEHVAERNHAKYPNGQVLLDANGKVVKPEGWTPPDHSNFVTSFRAD